VPTAAIYVQNLGGGQSTTIQTKAAGSLPSCESLAWEYEVSVSAAGFEAKIAKVTLATGCAD